MPLSPADITQIIALIASELAAARIKISALPAAGAVSRSAVFPIVDAGSTQKLSLDQLLARGFTTLPVGQDLRAIDTDTITDGEMFFITGVVSVNDGGGGFFLYDANSVATDNIGTVIAPDTGVGRFLRDYQGGLVNVKWFDARGNGTDEDTTAIMSAAAVVQANGGGTLLFPPGNYKVLSTTNGPLGHFIGLTGINVIGIGATITVDLTRVIVASLGHLFLFDSSTNIVVDGFTTNGPTLDVSSSTVKGFEFVRCVNGCTNIWMPNNRVVNMIAGFIASKLVGDPDSMRCRNIHIGNLDIENCWYGVNTQFSGDNLTVQNLTTDTVHRSLFVYGCDGVRANIRSKDHKSWDVLIACYQGIPTKNVRVNYTKGTNSTAALATAVMISFQDQTAGAIQDIEISMDIDFAVAGSGSNALVIQKLTNAGAFDVVDRGHVLSNLRVIGRVNGTPAVYNGGLIITEPSCVFGTGDFFSNFSFENVICTNGSAGAGTRWYLVLASLIDQIALRNVTTDQCINLTNIVQANGRPPNTAKVIIDGVTCKNLDVAVGAETIMPIRKIEPFGTPATIQSGWVQGSLKVITNDGMGGAGEQDLPAALPGMEAIFSRTVATQYDLDPNGTEVIQGGTAGQMLRLNAAGNLVHLRCVTAGVWEIVSSYGALAYV